MSIYTHWQQPNWEQRGAIFHWSPHSSIDFVARDKLYQWGELDWTIKYKLGWVISYDLITFAASLIFGLPINLCLLRSMAHNDIHRSNLSVLVRNFVWHKHRRQGQSGRALISHSTNGLPKTTIQWPHPTNPLGQYDHNLPTSKIILRSAKAPMRPIVELSCLYWRSF